MLWYISLNSDGTILAFGSGFNDGGGNNSGHVRVFQWRLYTQADNNTYYYQNRIQDTLQTKPLIITENLDTPPNPGNYYWTQLGLDIDGKVAEEYSVAGALSISLSSDGTNLAIGAPFNDDSATDSGQTRVYQISKATNLNVDDNLNVNKNLKVSGNMKELIYLMEVVGHN